MPAGWHGRRIRRGARFKGVSVMGNFRVLYLEMVIALSLGFWPSVAFTEPNPEIFSVTVGELMARPAYFDGIKVRVIAVASLDFSFEAIPAIYASKEDWKHWTGNRIDLKGVLEGDASSLSRKRMERMNGEYVILEGVFKYWSRENLKIEGGGFASCWPRCQHYSIEKITRLEEWTMKRKTH